MGFLDTLLGRTKPVPPNLDELFALPGAALTLQAGTDFTPTGSGSVCFRATEGKAFSDIEKDVQELLNMGNDSSPVQVTTDAYNFTWLVCKHSAEDPEGLVTDLHAVNSSLENGGFRAAAAVHDHGVPRFGRPFARAGLPVQAGHLLPVRAALRPGARQRA